MSVTAQTVLSALENLQKSYTGQKQQLEATLKSLKVNITEIDICLKNLLTNFGDKAELQVKLDKAVNKYDQASIVLSRKCSRISRKKKRK